MSHEGTLSTHDKLVYMANQIARFFHAEGDTAAIAGTADHIAKFWDPRMRAQIIAHLKAGGAGLDPIPKKAIEKIAQQATA